MALQIITSFFQPPSADSSSDDNHNPFMSPNHSTEPRSSIIHKRRLQHVLNHNQRGVIVSWKVRNAQDEGGKNICARTVQHFPQFFRGSTKANLQRASRYWKSRDTILSRYRNQSKKNVTSITRCTSKGLKTYVMKVSRGRGRKRSPWVTALYAELIDEFDRMRKAGIRFSARLLRTLAIKIVKESHNEIIGPDVRDPKSGDLITEHITPRWIQNFMQKNGIVSRSQCGKLMVSPAKRELIERQVAYHLGTLCREFRDGKIQEDDVMNADETHFVINTHNYKTLARKGEDEIKYADVVSGYEGMTMLVLLNGGKSSIHPPFMIFKNENSSYPIRGIPDNVPGVSYRTGPKGWIDSRLFCEWLKENRAISRAPDGRRRVLYMDNCSGHAVTEMVKEALEEKNIELRFFPANATDLVQPADSHLIQKIKAAWRTRWDRKVTGMIEKKCWTDARSGSGKLVNPGKTYFLQLAANSVRDVNEARHKNDGVLYSRRAMIKCGLSLNLNGQRGEKQLSRELQEIIGKHRANFDGEPVSNEGDLEGEATDTDEE